MAKIKKLADKKIQFPGNSQQRGKRVWRTISNEIKRSGNFLSVKIVKLSDEELKFFKVMPKVSIRSTESVRNNDHMFDHSNINVQNRSKDGTSEDKTQHVREVKKLYDISQKSMCAAGLSNRNSKSHVGSASNKITSADEINDSPVCKDGLVTSENEIDDPPVCEGGPIIQISHDGGSQIAVKKYIGKQSLVSLPSAPSGSSIIPTPPSPKKQRVTQSKRTKQKQLLSLTCRYFKKLNETKDSGPIVTKVWSEKLIALDQQQRLFAEKAINDVLFEASLGNLHKYSVKINEDPCPQRHSVQPIISTTSTSTSTSTSASTSTTFLSSTEGMQAQNHLSHDGNQLLPSSANFTGIKDEPESDDDVIVIESGNKVILQDTERMDRSEMISKPNNNFSISFLQGTQKTKEAEMLSKTVMGAHMFLPHCKEEIEES